MVGGFPAVAIKAWHRQTVGLARISKSIETCEAPANKRPAGAPTGRRWVRLSAFPSRDND